jgi:hypothetical protein
MPVNLTVNTRTLNAINSYGISGDGTHVYLNFQRPILGHRQIKLTSINFRNQVINENAFLIVGCDNIVNGYDNTTPTKILYKMTQLPLNDTNIVMVDVPVGVGSADLLSSDQDSIGFFFQSSLDGTFLNLAGIGDDSIVLEFQLI